MIKAYFNYPTSKVSIHRDPYCHVIRDRPHPGQRTSRINVRSLPDELRKFREKEYRFKAQSGWNDIWVVVDLADPEEELATVESIRKLLGRYYRPFAACVPVIHC